ncbi:MAG: ribosome assembly RNA-binding protein YhbY [Chloroflexota bacterium]
MLTGKQKAHLRGLGNTLEPVVQVGKGGIVDTVVTQASDALTARELIKGRILKNCEAEPDEVAAELAAATGAELVQIVGRAFLLYRRSPDKPRIVLPE